VNETESKMSNILSMNRILCMIALLVLPAFHARSDEEKFPF